MIARGSPRSCPPGCGRQRPELTFTVVLAELVVEQPLQRLVLHEDLEPRMRRALRTQRRVVVTNVPFHFPG